MVQFLIHQPTKVLFDKSGNRTISSLLLNQRNSLFYKETLNDLVSDIIEK